MARLKPVFDGATFSAALATVTTKRLPLPHEGILTQASLTAQDATIGKSSVYGEIFIGSTDGSARSTQLKKGWISRVPAGISFGVIYNGEVELTRNLSLNGRVQNNTDAAGNMRIGWGIKGVQV